MPDAQDRGGAADRVLSIEEIERGIGGALYLAERTIV
jgi:hypothetical protein